MSQPQPLSTLAPADLEALLSTMGVPPWRERQLRAAVWQPYVGSVDEIRQLPAELRVRLAEVLRFTTVVVHRRSIADSGRTLKLLCRLDDGQTVETVAMESPATEVSRRRGTVCVSSQVGCAVGCPFCATGQMGLRRNCAAAEIVDQVRAGAAALCHQGFGPVTNIVFMGMGEPLSNTGRVVDAIRVLARDGGISPRRITISTSGIIPGIEELAAAALPVRLALSMHAATDDLRDRLVPVNRRYPLADVLAVVADYRRRSGRRVTIEWCLIGGVNDSVEQADLLNRHAHGLGAHVNVIPMNHVDGSPWGPPDPAVSRRFLERLVDVPATIRDTRGAAEDAACGQLRADLEQRRWLLPDGTLAPPRRGA